MLEYSKIEPLMREGYFHLPMASQRKVRFVTDGLAPSKHKKFTCAPIVVAEPVMNVPATPGKLVASAVTVASPTNTAGNVMGTGL